MALDKTYSIRCESTDVHMRRAMNDRPEADAKEALDATREERVEIRRGCKGTTATEYSAKEARKAARNECWVRYGERFPLYRGAGPDDTSKIMFDICPSCAPKIIPGHIPAPVPPVHCKECNADLTQEAGLWVDAKSGDHGGTYDHCPMSSDHAHSPAR